MARARANKQHSKEFRAKAHATLDAWLDELEATGKPTPTESTPGQMPTLFELSMQIQETRQSLLGPILSAYLQRLVHCFANERQTPCPHCGKTLYCKRMAERTVLTLHGPVRVERPYFYCADDKYGFCPFDNALEMAQEVHQYDVQERLTRLASKMPYAEAVEQFKLLTGVDAGTHLAHDTVTRIEKVFAVTNVLPTADVLAAKIASAREAAAKTPPVLVVSVDGAFAPIRPEGGRQAKRGAGHWREVKGYRIYLTTSAGRITSLMSWHQIESSEELSRDLECAAARLPPDLEIPIVLVADGAAWIWTTMAKAFPNGRQVLDYYHCAEHVWEVANAQYEDPEESREWAEATLVRLGQGWVSEVLGSLTRMKPKDAAAAELIPALRGYLAEHRDRFGYHELKEKSQPRGSGGIESANKYLVQTRLKRPGAWWLEEHGNGMLRIRCALKNETFVKVFEIYMGLKNASQ